MNYIAIIAQDPKGVIGYNNTIPWSIPEDMKFFKETTSGHTVIMGRKTFESIGKALPNRRNIVLTRSPETLDRTDVEVYSDLKDIAYREDEIVFVIGGSQIYEMFLEEGLIGSILMSNISKEYEGDTFSPFTPTKLSEKGYRFREHVAEFEDFSVSFIFQDFSIINELDPMLLNSEL